ncbi:hypothetical protein ASPVEDRAFT_591077 [Aspergillus versicolor CBS 583.65]|uniref:SGNH hydrolase-type esterase domain-containing protein n=1 Tax=Aspergillus versicolor CBS 583.65 TaxID=1036611 RepID=A0A1L9PH54_ASPVE|nr:uncharacterized protein ASPVEDRAFT_591077 [Aspergillus versicolor CBS 583.65]OJJ00832.1 hypothetical protein ASPVEDRAFT_591077 [Aspergillus versicolor CBS 583.65]
MLYLQTISYAVAFAFTFPLVTGSLPPLRIMPLGDSITRGTSSPDITGYRHKLRSTLQNQQAGLEVDMIGSLQEGEMADNDHEGHSGKYLSDIRQYLELSIQAQPNIVCLHAGTNNMDLEVDLDSAGGVMEDIIDRLLEASQGVTVLVAPVIWANDTRIQANTDAFNEKLANIMEGMEGRQVLSVPVNITLEDLWDRKHPNERGYGKMADAWFKAVLDAQKRGWIREPESVDKDELPGMGLGQSNDGETSRASRVRAPWIVGVYNSLRLL